MIEINAEKHYKLCNSRPDVIGLIIKGKRGRILATLYTAAGNSKKPTVIMLHGIPGNEQNGDIAQALRRNGFNVLTFHYSGCFGSDGDYSLSNDVEDANTVLDFVLKSDDYDFDKKRIFALGHSMGGFVCAQLTAHRKEIKGGVLLMPCDIGRIFQIGKENQLVMENLLDVLKESSAFLNGASLDLFIRELSKNSEEFRLESLKTSLSKKPLLCVEGLLDVHTPPEYHCRPLEAAIKSENPSNLTVVGLETDHFSCDYRLKLIEVTVSFLLGLLK